MILLSLSLSHFRNYAKAVFPLHETITLLIGPNAAGKTNFLEALYLLSTGKSFRAEKDIQMIEFGQDITRVKGTIKVEEEETSLEVVIAKNNGSMLQKRYLVNEISKKRENFAGILKSVLFLPEDLDIISGEPSLRRRFLDEVLEQTDLHYRLALSTYSKALRQRNALLDNARDTGIRNDKLFSYWDELLIANGQLITKKREDFIHYINGMHKELIPFMLVYDNSIISTERLLQYKDAEVGAGVTLVGPHRDDFRVEAFHPKAENIENMKYFGSRGQQRLVVLELKLLQLSYLEQILNERPILLLDDIFSELDKTHIALISHIISKQQTIITTTHKEFGEELSIPHTNMIELQKEE